MTISRTRREEEEPSILLPASLRQLFQVEKLAEGHLIEH